jgi:hypothetical protein
MNNSASLTKVIDFETPRRYNRVSGGEPTKVKKPGSQEHPES